MNAPEQWLLPDVQAIADRRNVYINRVGVKSLVHPVRVGSPDGSAVATVATVDMTVGLAHEVKGTHMSRFVEVLQQTHEALDAASFAQLLSRMLDRLGAESGMIEMRFPYFISKRAPVSGVASLLDYRVMFRGEHSGAGAVFTTQVAAPATSLCPCSKEISEYGAHNQRSEITITVQGDQPIAIEELAGIAEQEASCEVYGLLKRPDEKYVTEKAYDNPKFVEDLVRDIALRLDADDRVRVYTVEAENFESIHNHSAYALVERAK
ncbi:MAG: GTP cyclohydrolase FolE2 [Burkholderiales bacterium]|nr:GTP cyclohydrolase FolE2 [Burkholderiales bacterium]